MGKVLGRSCVGLFGSVLALGACVLGSAGAARASDNGIIGFFQQQFGSEPRQAEPLPQPDDAASPPLTVRMRPRHHASRPSASPKDTLASLKGVTIYTDKTLERGDAVMTANGMRIFNGSASWPYTDEDFVALSETHVSAAVRKQLSAMDIASRADAHR